MEKSQDLYRQAKQLIPGGTQLISKRPEMFLPEKWPSYYKKAKGVKIWDLDNKEYTDMSIMGIGACVLGYANETMGNVIKKAVDDGNMSTLNTFEEVELAQKLVDLHPWAQMARFAKTGGEINAVAIRIARAYSKKDKIAFCGYHGWHDWYIAANLSDDKSLDGQLLPGLKPAGVPKVLRGTSLPFHYGKIAELKEIVSKNKNEIGVIIMEVMKSQEINLEFLHQIREIADEIDAVLIFDEVSSGFRATTGGMHMLYDINPDMMTLGKALGNGYPIAAVLGKKDIMEAAQESFISSTYWTERLGFVAALEVIRQFEECDVVDHLKKVDEKIRRGLAKIFTSQEFDIEVVGMPAVPILAIKEEKPLVIKTLITQEMLKKGFLASNVIFVSSAHTEGVIDEYLNNMDEVLSRIASAKKNGKLEDMLEGPVCHGAFKRLN